MYIPDGIRNDVQAVGNAEGMIVIDGREWSDGKLVISVVSSSGYLSIFISILCIRWFLRLSSSSSLSANSVETSLGFLNAEKVVSHAVLEFIEWMQIKSIALSVFRVSCKCCSAPAHSENYINIWCHGKDLC